MDCLDCKICQVPYDEENHRPRNSRCGHEFCTACLKSLINNGTFICPKCRRISEVNDPDDLPVNYGLIDVIRAFKTQNISLTQKSEVCYEHLKDIKYRCCKCKTWLCDECLDQTRNHRGCNGTRVNIISAPLALNKMKERHTNYISILRTSFMEKVNYAPSLIQDYKNRIQELIDMGEVIIENAEKQKKEILDSAEKQCKEIMEVAETHKEELLERAKKHGEEIKMLHDLLEHGNKQNEKFLEWDNHLQSTSSPYRLMDNTLMLKESMQLMKGCVETLEAYTLKSMLMKGCVETLEAYTLKSMLKDVKENKEVYFEMVIKNEKMYGKLSQHEENVYFHFLRNQIVPDSSISIPFPRLHEKIHDASLVFLELSLGDVVLGRVLVRLYKNSPKIRNNMVAIVTGISGKSLAGTELSSWDSNETRTDSLPFRDIPVIPDEKVTEPSEKCNVVGYYGNGYLRIIYFSIIQRCSGSTGQYPIGYIESGIDILQECYDKLPMCYGITSNCECKSLSPQSCIYPNQKLKITDCGLVIEEQE